MKKYLLLAIFVLTLPAYCDAFWPFGDLKLSNEMKNMKNSTEKNYSDIKAGVNDVKAGVNDVNNKQTAIGNELGVMKGNIFSLSQKLDLAITSKMFAQAGAGNTSQATDIKSGRDTNQRTSTRVYNDPTILKGVVGLMTLIVTQMFLTLRGKDKQISKLMERQADFIKTQEQAQQKYFGLIERIAMSVISDLIRDSKPDKCSTKITGV